MANITPDSILPPRAKYDGGELITRAAILINSAFERGTFDNWILTGAASQLIDIDANGSYFAEFQNTAGATATMEYAPPCGDQNSLAVVAGDVIDFTATTEILYGDATVTMYCKASGERGTVTSSVPIANGTMNYTIPAGYDRLNVGFEISGGTTQTMLKVNSIGVDVTRGVNAYQVNTAIFFNGVTDYVELPTPNFNQDEGAWEVLVSAAWTTLPDNSFRVFSSTNSAGSGSEFRTHNGSEGLSWYINGSTSYVSFGSIPATDWERVRLSASWQYDSTANQTTINAYFNGNLTNTLTITGKIALPDSILIGKWGTDFFSGIVDEVRVFNLRPNESDFSVYAFKPYPEFSSNLDFYWRFNSDGMVAENEVSKTYGNVAINANLVENGYGEAGDNTNFGDFSYVADATAPGGNAFEVTATSGTAYGPDTLIPVDIAKPYLEALSVKYTLTPTNGSVSFTAGATGPFSLLNSNNTALIADTVSSMNLTNWQGTVALSSAARTNWIKSSANVKDVSTWGIVPPVGAEVAAIVSGGHAYIWTGSGGSQSVAQTNFDTFDGNEHSFFGVVEKRLSDTATITEIGIYDTTTHTFVILGKLTWADGSFVVVAGAGTVTAKKLTDSGPNGGVVYKLTVAGTGTAGDSIGALFYPTGVPTNSDTVVVHCAQYVEFADPGAFILTGTTLSPVTDYTDNGDGTVTLGQAAASGDAYDWNGSGAISTDFTTQAACYDATGALTGTVTLNSGTLTTAYQAASGTIAPADFPAGTKLLLPRTVITTSDGSPATVRIAGISVTKV